MKKIKNFFIQLLILAIKTIYREKIELFFSEIGEKTRWQLFTNPVLVPVKKGTRKYYIFEYVDGDGKHRVHLSRHEFNRKGSKFPITITTDEGGMQHYVDGLTGITGPMGITGVPYGLTGITGPMGITGVPYGLTGITGPMGITGVPFDEHLDYTPDTPESYIGKDRT